MCGENGDANSRGAGSREAVKDQQEALLRRQDPLHR